MSENIKKSLTPKQNEIKDINVPKFSQEQTDIRKPSTLQNKNVTNKLHNLLDENEEDIIEEEDIHNISFSLSENDDMNDMLDNFSNKSDEKVEIEFESTTNVEGLELIEDFLRETTKQILNNKKGFDEDIKKMSSDFYSNLVKKIAPQKDIDYSKVKPNYLDKTKNTNYKNQSESMISDEATRKFKNDLIGQTSEKRRSEEFTHNYSKYSNNSKNKSKTNSINKIGSNSLEEEEEEDDNDKIIEIKKKKRNIKIIDEK
jgi:hypothetical protein